jgi:hypothetical protein
MRWLIWPALVALIVLSNALGAAGVTTICSVAFLGLCLWSWAYEGGDR